MKSNKEHPFFLRRRRNEQTFRPQIDVVIHRDQQFLRYIIIGNTGGLLSVLVPINQAIKSEMVLDWMLLSSFICFFIGAFLSILYFASDLAFLLANTIPSISKRKRSDRVAQILLFAYNHSTKYRYSTASICFRIGIYLSLVLGAIFGFSFVVSFA